jgi:hypothetical protein
MAMQSTERFENSKPSCVVSAIHPCPMFNAIHLLDGCLPGHCLHSTNDSRQLVSLHEVGMTIALSQKLF